MTSLSNLNDDVLDIVCALANEADHPLASLEALSLTGKRMHALSVPHLFRTIKLHFSGSKEWEQGSIRLKSWNPELGPFVRSCDVHISFSYRSFEDQDPGTFVPELAAQLPEFLGTLTRLRRMACTIPDGHICKFREAFCNRASTLSFPLVKELCGASSRIVGPFCPNVKYFDISEPSRPVVMHILLNELLKDDFRIAENVTYLRLYYCGMPRNLEAARDCFPNLKILMLKGQFFRPFYDLIPLLASFSATLKVLVIPRAAELKAGFNPPWYDMIYRGPSRHEIRKGMEVEEKKARENVTKAVFSACKHLEELWVGTAIRARVERREGNVHHIQYDLDLDWEVELAKRKRENDC